MSERTNGAHGEPLIESSGSPLPPGRFIVVEGLDRVGKSTQCRNLTSRLRSLGVSVQQLRFPDRNSPIGVLIGEYLTSSSSSLGDEAIHLLFSANRWESAPEMRRLLIKGKWLVVDRYTYSGVAYSAAKGLAVDWCQSPDHGLPVPDLVVYLSLEVDQAVAHQGYGEERYERPAFQQKVKEVFEKTLREPDWAWIDASGTETEVAERIWTVIKSRFFA